MDIGYALKSGDQVPLWTRGQNKVGGRFERIAVMMQSLPVTSCTIDGEAIVRRSDGHSALGCEGIVVSKRVESIYRSGSSAGDWVKTLNFGYVRAGSKL